MKNSKSTSVFLVDDDPYSLAMYEQHLHNLGYTNTTCFSSGQECIEHLNEKPSVVFLDYNMPPMDGLDVLKKIKSLRPGTCIVFLSGQANLDVAVDSLKCGAFDYILKGSNDLDKINEVMEKFEAVQEKVAHEGLDDEENKQQYAVSNRWYGGENN